LKPELDRHCGERHWRVERDHSSGSASDAH
jgi:hypothetical protein